MRRADDEAAQESSSAPLHVAVGALAVVAIVLAAIVALVATKGSHKLHPGQPIPGETKTFQMLSGVPQHGFALGSASAPVTLTEYADLHCSTCAEFANDALPELVSEYVATGKLRIVFQPLDSNPDSLRAARIAAALALQNRLWQFVGLLFRNQESANKPFVTETYVASLIEAIPGAELARALGARNTTTVAQEIARFATEAHRRGLSASPSFELSRTGGRERRLRPTSLVDAASFASAIERELKAVREPAAKRS
ncbi:MAG: DsbA family protein [Solirubrobacteraceae bacterium]